MRGDPGRVQLDETSYAGVHGQLTARHGVLEERWLDFRANTVGGDITAIHAAAVPSAAPAPEHDGAEEAAR